MTKLMFSWALYVAYMSLSCFQSIFSQLKLTPSLKKVLFATALGSVALALTAHQLKRRGRKRKQVTQGKEGQKTVGIPEALMKTGRPSSLKRGVNDFIFGGKVTLNVLKFALWLLVHLLINMQRWECFSLYRPVYRPTDDEPQHSEQWHHEWNFFPGPQ